ncbi:MAG: dipicolinate synthase subunit B [Firmicutes bacterium]|nr:dipicolinate synthase subunit B [Bacillota bacterium]
MIKLGVCLCGSFCTFSTVIEELKKLRSHDIDIYPIMSYNAQSTDTRFGSAEDFIKEIESISERKIIRTISEAEPIGPKKMFDALLVAPCTGNTLAKLNSGITDTPVLMACKAHLRNERPLIIALASNDAMGINFKNIGDMLNRKNIYFVPFSQDDCIKKPNSLVAKFDLIYNTIESALDGRQLQPVLA